MLRGVSFENILKAASEQPLTSYLTNHQSEMDTSDEVKTHT